MAKKRVTEIVEDLLKDFVEANNMELVEVEFIKEGPHRYLRIFIDKYDDKISLSDCKLVSDYLNEKIDKLDPIMENYFLEVSSPGIERPFKKDSDYERNIGKIVQAKLFSPLDGRKTIDGTLVGFEDSKVSIKINDDEVLVIPKDKISIIKPVVQL